MTHIGVKLGGALLLAFLVALFAMAASPPTEILYTRSGGCPDSQPVAIDA